MKDSWTRREFVQATVLLASALGTAGCADLPGTGAQASSGSNAGEPEAQTFDYIVVGAGAGGGPLSCRLARLGAKVLLIDAGQYTGNNPLVDIPVFNIKSTEDPKISWSFMVDHYQDKTKKNQRL